MKTKIRLLVCLFFICAFWACKKDTISNDQAIPAKEDIKQKVKDWYEGLVPVKINKPTASRAKEELPFNPRIGKPAWEKTTYSEADKISITPFTGSYKAGTIPNRFLITDHNNGTIVNGYVCFILSDKNKPSGLAEINPGILSATQIAGFSGAIIKYDLNGSLISSRHFNNGYLENGKTDRMMHKLNTAGREDNTSNYVEEYCFIIDHWWVTYLNGEIVSIEWEGSTEVCSGGNGGGGGGGNNGPSASEVAAAAATAIVNSGTPSTVSLDEVLESETPTHRTKLYSWKCVSSATWYVVAHDRGVHRKRAAGWEWLSLENLGISLHGYAVGGTLNATKNYANPIMGTYNSKMDISVNITSTVNVSGVTWTSWKEYSSVKTWNVNSAANPGY